jgi:hypothetical protein
MIPIKSFSATVDHKKVFDVYRGIFKDDMDRASFDCPRSEGFSQKALLYSIVRLMSSVEALKGNGPGRKKMTEKFSRNA